MGKRKKSSKPMGPKKRDPLPTQFKCVFCNAENQVTVRIDKKAGVGNLICKSCGQSYQCGINYLSQPVDVYADWVDACEAVATETAGTGSAVAASTFRPSQPQPARAGLAPAADKYEDDGFIDDDEADGEADYADDD